MRDCVASSRTQHLLYAQSAAGDRTDAMVCGSSQLLGDRLARGWLALHVDSATCSVSRFGWRRERDDQVDPNDLGRGPGALGRRSQ